MEKEETRIRKLRKEKKLSGTEVAERLGITAQYYYDIERGKRRLKTEIAVGLADILGTTVDYLLGKTDVNLYDWLPSPTEELSEMPMNVVKETHDRQYTAEREFLSEIELSDSALMDKYKVKVDGRELTDKEWKKLLAFLRLERELD